MIDGQKAKKQTRELPYNGPRFSRPFVLTKVLPVDAKGVLKSR